MSTGDSTAPMRCLQLAELTERGRFLAGKLSARAARTLPGLNQLRDLL